MNPFQSPENNKDLILNLRKPHVFKNIALDWKCFSQDLHQWIASLDDSRKYPDGIVFDCGSIRNGLSPQWERKRSTVRMTGKQFLDTCSHCGPKKNEKWMSFSYKDLNELPVECREGVSLGALGFNTLDEFNFWLGSAGAHTPCHFDTYGCNVVVQVFGRKSWLLFPPTAKLTPTRVPYEESSVYCMENFCSPADNAEFRDLEADAHHVVLEPGDVLLVPPEWWHYVESIDVSLAINTWIPLDRDLDKQIAECLTKINITENTRNLTESLKRRLINPNELSSLYSFSLAENLKLLNQLKSLKRNEQLRKEILSTFSSNYLDDQKIEKILSERSDDVIAVPRLSKDEFRSFIEKNTWRFRESHDDDLDELESAEEYAWLLEFINVMSSKAVVESINQDLFKTFS